PPNAIEIHPVLGIDFEPAAGTTGWSLHLTDGQVVGPPPRRAAAATSWPPAMAKALARLSCRSRPVSASAGRRLSGAQPLPSQAEVTEMAGETAEQRRRREAKRVLFDDIAGLYDTARQGYPDEMVDE